MNEGFAALARALLPEAVLVLGALLALAGDLTALRRRSAAFRLKVAAGWASAAAVAAAVLLLTAVPAGPVFGGALQLDSLATGGGLAVLAFLLVMILAATAAPAPAQPAEYVALALFSATGLVLLTAANELILGFAALELASIPLYVLTGYNRTRPDSAEAAIKYFLFGATAAAFLLFGFSLLYGATGSLRFDAIARSLYATRSGTLVGAGLVLVLVGLGFKTATAPFHFWAPDAYQGAPASAGALIASGSKLAGWIFFARLLVPALGAGGHARLPAWAEAAAVLVAASVLIGNLAALAQSNVRRLLAYSAVSHAGALLLAVMACGRAGAGPLFYYAATYGLATVGTFGVLAILERTGDAQDLSALAGMWRRSPLLAACLLVFILSLAGVPPFAGFFGKVLVFSAAFKAGALPSGLAAGAILFSAVGFYYYLRILKQVLVASSSEAPIRPAPAAAAAVAAAAALTLLFGLFPSLLLR